MDTLRVPMLLDRARQALDLESDAGLAKALKITPQTVSQWRLGDVPVPDARIVQLAQMAGDPEELWLMIAKHDQARSEPVRKAWKAGLLRLAAAHDGVLLPAIAMFLLCAMPFAGNAQPKAVSAEQLPTNVYYVIDQVDQGRRFASR